jgi:hypothetical protein
VNDHIAPKNARERIANSLRLGQWIGIAILVVVCGCGDGHPKRVPASGVVLIDGQPLSQGNIKFVPKNGRPSAGKIGPDGHFSLTCYDGNDGALLGTHQVQVAANHIISDSKIEWFAPSEYADFRTANLNVEVTKPVDDLKIELSWGGRKGPFVQAR